MDTSLLTIAMGLATLGVLALMSQHRAETTKVLSQGEARLRSLVQNSSDIITILGADGIIRYESPAVERILGYKPEDLVGKSGFDYIHPEDASIVQAAFAKILENPGMVPVEYRFRQVNGAWVYLASVGTNCLDDPSVRGVVVNSRDISERKQAESSLRFLVEASTVLTASLDYETTLASVARLAVPQIADWCVVDIAGEEGAIRRLAVAHLDPAMVELVWELDQRYPENPQGAEGVPKVLRTGEPQIYPEIPDALLVAVAQDAEHLKILRELGCKSAIIMPLSARDRTLGALTFVISESGRRYGDADLSLAAELASRAALAMDNARLYQDLKAREVQFRRIVDSNIIGVIFWNVSGNITEANDAFLEMVGYTRSELLSGAVRWTDMTPKEYTQQDQRVLAELAATGACNPFEKEYIRKDGTCLPILLGATLMEGSQEQGVCFVLDITAQKRAEAALRQSEERYRAFIEQSSEGIWRFELEQPIAIVNHSNQALQIAAASDCVASVEFPEGLPGNKAASNPLPSEDQRIQHFYQYGYLAECNDAMAQMYGLSRAEEIVGARLDQFLVRTDPRNTEYLRAFIRSGYRLVDAESYEVDTLGNSRYFLNNLVGTVEQGVLVRAWGIQRDITVAKRLEAERQQAESALRSRAAELAHLTAALTQTNTALEKRNQELDQFAYITSHDLKAPLRAIANLSQWLEEDLSGKLTTETQHQMHLLRGRVQRMETLIDGILQYSRAGRVEAVKPVAVEQLLGEVIDSLAPPPAFAIQVEPGMPTLLTERLPLEQVFANLIGNAVKHHHFTQGKITLSAQDRPEFCEFAVADDGPGIPPQYHEKVFAIFQTLEARDTVESTGVGLAIVKKIVESKGGTIRLESQAGQGTTFYFTWPKHPQPTHGR